MRSNLLFIVLLIFTMVIIVASPALALSRGGNELIKDGGARLTIGDSSTQMLTAAHSPARIDSDESFSWWAEAEDGAVSGGMAIGTSEGASGCSYVYTTQAWSNDSVSFTVNLPESGDYYLWARAMGLGWSDNSFFISIDDGQEFHYEIQPVGETEWTWSWQRQPAPPPDYNEEPIFLDAGEHTIRFKSREGNARLDRILLTNDAFYAPNDSRDFSACATPIIVNAACTLADAITAANTDTATGNCPAGSGADTIQLDVDVTLIRALPRISSEITIEGGDHFVSGDNRVRVFYVESSGVFTLHRVTVKNGQAEGHSPYARGGGVSNQGAFTLTDSTLKNNRSSYAGGGIYNEGLAEISNSTFSGNSSGGSGGSIYNDGLVDVSNSTFSGNSSGGSGGGIFNSLTLYVYDSTFSGNSAYSDGGGLFNYYTGYMTVRDSDLTGNSAYSDGGGIYNVNLLTVTNSTLSGNRAVQNGGGIYSEGPFDVNDSVFSENSADSGGGIYNRDTLTVIASTFTGNSVTDDGGGIYSRGALSVNTSTFTGNRAFDGSGLIGYGGGLNIGGSAEVSDSTFSDNIAERGSGISNGGTLTLTNSTLSGNDSPFQFYDRGVGSITNWNTLTVIGSTIVENRLGIYNMGAKLTVIDSTIARNYYFGIIADTSLIGEIRGSQLWVKNSVVAENTAEDVQSDDFYDRDCIITPQSSVTSQGYNIEGGTECGFNGTGDQQNVSVADLALRLLADYGGPTPTMALGAGSTALDRIPPGNCAENADQRGVPRPQNGKCDVGAFEYTAPTANAGGPYGGNENAPISLDGSGSSDGAGIVSYEWDCTDDGVYDVDASDPMASSCTYAEPGAYTVKLRVTNAAGETAVATAAVRVDAAVFTTWMPFINQ